MSALASALAQMLALVSIAITLTGTLLIWLEGGR